MMSHTLNIGSQDSKKEEKRLTVRIPFQVHAGLFSNLIIPMNTAWCYQQYDIVCIGWPSDIHALIPNICVESNESEYSIIRQIRHIKFKICRGSGNYLLRC